MVSDQVRTCRTMTSRNLRQVQQVRVAGDTPRSRGRYTDNGDDRIFRQATDDERGQRARPDRGGSESGFRQGHLDFISMAMNMARPHSDDPEAMPTRSPRSLVPGESQASDEFGDRPRGPGTMVSAPRDMSGRSTGSQASDTMPC